MKQVLFLFGIVSLAISCGSQNKTDYRLKLGPVWYDNEQRLDFVYGLRKSFDESQDFITELHLNFGGDIECTNKTLTASFDCDRARHLILPDSINNIRNSYLERIRNSSSVLWKFNNPSPGVLVFTIEKINLKPQGHQDSVVFRLDSECGNYLELPMSIVKYSTGDITSLVDLYVRKDLDNRTRKSLLNTKVIFSFNSTRRMGDYVADMVDQRTMQVLSFNSSSDEYIVNDYEGHELRRIKRGT